MPNNVGSQSLCFLATLERVNTGEVSQLMMDSEQATWQARDEVRQDRMVVEFQNRMSSLAKFS